MYETKSLTRHKTLVPHNSALQRQERLEPGTKASTEEEQEEDSMRIAVVGGGITGAIAVSELAGALEKREGERRRKEKTAGEGNVIAGGSGSRVVLFDQGRRGPGGRASHRSVGAVGRNTRAKDENENENGTKNKPNEPEPGRRGAREPFEVRLCDDASDLDGSDLQFDHGCQFFRADSAAMGSLVESWLEKGWVGEWGARFGSLPETSPKRRDRGAVPLPADGGGSGNGNGSGAIDFFGIPPLPRDSGSGGRNDAVYIGIGGMHLLPRRILEESLSSSFLEVHRGTRVSGVTRRARSNDESNDKSNDESNNDNNEGLWDLTTAVGTAAFHDTSEARAREELARAAPKASGASPPLPCGGNKSGNDESPNDKDNGNDRTSETKAPAATTRVVLHAGFDAVVFTDVSASSGSWHRASAGIPRSFCGRLPPRLRVPLFSCMVALERPIRDKLPFDAFVAHSGGTDGGKQGHHPVLWFASCSDAKPGFFPGAGGSSEGESDDKGVSRPECWTLVSTPAFAVAEIKETTMRDPVTGEFRPQEDAYLNSGPGPRLFEAFCGLVRPYLQPETDGPRSESPPNDPRLSPRAVYLQAQRWGSGLPIDPGRVPLCHREEVCGTWYASDTGGSLVYESGEPEGKDDPTPGFVADDQKGLYYAGDFCSSFNPGFEAAALSGWDLARHIEGRLR